jgi:ATP-dependent 26S proteasome regulatory subunit
LREPPLVGAVIIKKVRGELRQKVDKYLVMSSVGIIYCVNVNPLLKNIILESGMYVLLNQRTFAIMEVLSLTKEEVLKAADKLPHLYQVPEK